jgi:hypothetical protein
MTKTPLSLLIVRVREQLRKRRVATQNETPQDKFSRRTANATVLIGVLTIGVILVAIFQYVVFSHQLNVMQGQLDEMRSLTPSALTSLLLMMTPSQRPPTKFHLEKSIEFYSKTMAKPQRCTVAYIRCAAIGPLNLRTQNFLLRNGKVV